MLCIIKHSKKSSFVLKRVRVRSLLLFSDYTPDEILSPLNAEFVGLDKKSSNA